MIKTKDPELNELLTRLIEKISKNNDKNIIFYIELNKENVEGVTY